MNAQNERLDGFSREGRWMQRYLFSGALQGELDRQGRVALPASLLQHARSARTSSSPACGTGSRSGTARPGAASSPRSKGAPRVLPNVLPIEALKLTYPCWRARSARCSTCIPAT